MRAFTLVLALAATAFAGVVPRSEEATAASSAADVAYTPPAPMGDLKGIDWNEFFECHCPKDNNGDLGVHINQGKWWYQCAYPGGACQWDDVRDIYAFEHYHIYSLCSHKARQAGEHKADQLPQVFDLHSQLAFPQVVVNKDLRG
jgi:hypothetical protein